jgi:zinc transporter ZupT
MYVPSLRFCSHFLHHLVVALVLAGIGAIFTLGIDQVAHHVILRVHSSNTDVVKEGGESNDLEGAAAAAAPAAVENDKYIVGKCEHKCDHQHPHEILVVDNEDAHVSTKAWIMEGAVAVHSVIIGFGFGILTQQDVGTIRILTSAFSVHQFFEGISLGTVVLENAFDKKTNLKFAITFASTFPVGAIIGMIIKSVESNTESDAAILTQGVANALAAGILLHTALCEMIPDDFASCHSHHQPSDTHSHHQLPQSNSQSKSQIPPSNPKGALKLGMYLSLSVGFGIMALLAMWA